MSPRSYSSFDTPRNEAEFLGKVDSQAGAWEREKWKIGCPKPIEFAEHPGATDSPFFALFASIGANFSAFFATKYTDCNDCAAEFCQPCRS